MCRTRGARVVLEQVLRRYSSAQMVIADGTYDKEGLLEWLLEEFCVGLDCVSAADFLALVANLGGR